jgi:signal transduction histidine kinase
MVLSLSLVAIIGVVDFLTGFELYFFSIYLIPVTLAAWFIGRGFGFFVSVLCVAISVTGDVLAGLHYSSRFVLVWNAAIALGFYFAVVWILAKLRALHNELEERVRQRTAALHNEIQERRRLEEEILRISEREQVRIGHDLHDSLCQHLTGIALAGEVLSEQLVKSPPQAEAANHIVELVEDAIELTRRLARGLHPVELTDEGFMDALHELAANVTERFKIPCRFECQKPVLVREPEVTTHLYRIAQEATTNAVKHAKPTEIVIRLESADGAIALTVSDNGVGLPKNRPNRDGMGLRIMAYRASVIGATFKVEHPISGGTRVTCILPEAGRISAETYAAKSESISS